ncbi:uncharacterized protein LOC120354182 [Nilaparvata lugens]|uniref:uncharacterized protein LOC120354182 n=1 Tax=Nilaparvata lugens TaxID=108931 RepID=UPI00193D1D55|nr:uncharacterized protein LOC120354182 [Nilaparvata lugens]
MTSLNRSHLYQQPVRCPTNNPSPTKSSSILIIRREIILSVVITIIDNQFRLSLASIIIKTRQSEKKVIPIVGVTDREVLQSGGKNSHCSQPRDSGKSSHEEEKNLPARIASASSDSLRVLPHEATSSDGLRVLPPEADRVPHPSVNSTMLRLHIVPAAPHRSSCSTSHQLLHDAPAPHRSSCSTMLRLHIGPAASHRTSCSTSHRWIFTLSSQHPQLKASCLFIVLYCLLL